jgi:hypothetical protein
MSRLLTVLAVFGLVLVATLAAEATPKKKTRTEYVVVETNPITGGVVSTTRFPNKSAADRQFAARRKAHWVKWRYAGINEPLRFKRFNSSFEAQRFIDTDGPSKSGKFGFAILTNETRNVPTRVKLTAVAVPVSGGGNRGGDVDPDKVIGAIDRIIGILQP